MRYRRWGALAVITLLCGAGVGAEQAATELIQHKVHAVLAILRDPALQGPARRTQRRQRILEEANTIFAWDEIARSSLGVTWRELDPTRRARFVELFRGAVANYYLDQIDSLAGTEQVTVKAGMAEGARQMVTTVVRGRRQPVQIDYYLEKYAEGWRVVDLSVEGVSVVNNYRSRFRHYLTDHSFDDLLTRLRIGRSRGAGAARRPS